MRAVVHPSSMRSAICTSRAALHRSAAVRLVPRVSSSVRVARRATRGVRVCAAHTPQTLNAGASAFESLALLTRRTRHLPLLTLGVPWGCLVRLAAFPSLRVRGP